MAELLKSKGYQKKGVAHYTGSTGSLSLGAGSEIPLFVTELFNDSESITKSTDYRATLKAGKKYYVETMFAFLSGTAGANLYFSWYDITGAVDFGNSGNVIATNYSVNTFGGTVKACGFITPLVDTTICCKITAIAGTVTSILYQTTKIEEVESLLSETLGRTRFTEDVVFDGLAQFDSDAGIGVAPSYRLHVEENSTNQVCYIKNTNGGGYGLAVEVAGDTGTEWIFRGASNATDKFYVYNDGDGWIAGDFSALSFTDRTPCPKTVEQAIEAVKSIKPLPKGKYKVDNKEKQLDHNRLHPYLQGKGDTPNRDMSANISCNSVAIQYLLDRLEEKDNEIDNLYKLISEKPPGGNRKKGFFAKIFTKK